MSFDWLNKFHQGMEKGDNYAEKTLAAYKLGMKAKGSIAGVRIEVAPDSCTTCKQIDTAAIYHPDDAPRLPLATCDRKGSCRCVYRPVMTYEVEDKNE